MRVTRSLALGLGLALLAPLAAPGGVAGAAGAPAPDPTVTDARAWLVAQQQADGGFELAGFPGFETSDAIQSLAAAAQTGPTWDAAAALAAVQGVTKGGHDPLHAIDDLIDGEADPSSAAAGARAAKLLSLVVLPLGLDPHDVDPDGDSASAVDLVARVEAHRQGDDSFDFGAQFNGVLYAAVALHLLGEEVPAGLLGQIEGGQRADGSWDYTGSPTAGDGDDIDTTSLAVIALTGAGRTTDDAVLADAVAWLAGKQQADGAWAAFGADDPNATAFAAIALSDAHVDVTSPAWRVAFGGTAGAASPYAWLRTQQADDGRIASPNDAYGVNTYPTTQTIESLARQWYLADDRADLLARFGADLASPAASPSSTAGNDVASDLVGPNPSSQAARSAAAAGLLTSPVGRQAAAADLFQQAFGRAIDPSGRTYWSTKLLTITRPEMLSRLTGSSEFYRRAGGTIPTFVDAVYHSVLGRNPDPSGKAYWVKRLQGGASVERVARSLVASGEYRRRQVTNAYGRLLDRAPTTDERDFWAAWIVDHRIETLLAHLGASAEYYGDPVA
jgi:hypothetical protein